MLFETNENFYEDIWQLEKIKLPENSEEKFPGLINSIVYLFAEDNLRAWLRNKDLNADDALEYYYEFYRSMVNANLISHDTYGLCRMASFLYGYAKPFFLKIGRLVFQYFVYRDYSKMYEDECGKRVFVALPNYTYNNKGLQEKDGFVPIYEKNDNILTAHTFEKNGAIKCETSKIDLDKYKLILKPGDAVLTIHIPGGGKLDINKVKKSISDAKVFFRKHFPAFKAIVCQTWFIDPHLRGEVVKDGSNMAAFADLFDVICGTDNENHSIFEHVFRVKKQPLENLIPQNDFQNRILTRALNGEKIYWSFGVLKKEEE